MAQSRIGISHGLAWTAAECQLIQIKTTLSKGCGKILVDCDIGHDFLESVEVVIEYLQAQRGFDLTKVNLKVFIPGALEGPSAGLPLLISIYSALTKQPVNQSMAFTGRLLANGEIKGVGELISKLAAAQRANLKTVVFPLDNLKDLPQYKDRGPFARLILAPVRHAEEALKLCLPE